jgi:hypothetical protein
MRPVIVVLVLFVIFILIDCSMDADNPFKESGIDDPPIPTTSSIFPLAVGNHWTYWYTKYDSAGIKIPLSNRILTRKIPGAYKFTSEGDLVPYEKRYGTHTNSSKYVYKLEWEDLDRGLLVMHVGDGDLSSRGLYIVGEYSNDTTTLYTTRVLWLAFPASKGAEWTVSLPGNDSSVNVTKMELVDHNALFYAPVGNRYSASPVYFRDSCYLYKEAIDNFTTYYYFHPKVGCLGYLQYQDSTLVTTYIMTDFEKKYYYDGFP